MQRLQLFPWRVQPYSHTVSLHQPSEEAGENLLSLWDIYSGSFAVFSQTTCLTQTNTSRKLSVACTVRMAASFFLLLKVSFAFSSGVTQSLFFTFKF